MQNLTPQSYSSMCLISFLLFVICSFSACSARTVFSPAERESGAIALGEARSKYGLLRPARAMNYQNYVIDRLRVASRTQLPFYVNVVSSEEPFAYHGGGGEILISAGLLLRLKNEAEFAFVVAHEMAHAVYEHQADNTHEQNLSQEIEADSFAIGAIALAGYDPRVALTGMLNSYAYQDAVSSNHPDLDTRLRHLRDYLKRSGWKPPGSTNARNYRKYQGLLVNQHHSVG